MRTVTLIDYDMGNLRSLANALRAVDADVRIADHGDGLRDARHVILPGVGAFGASMHNLRERHLDHALRHHVDAGRPFLGICLGFQVLFERGTENGRHDGLGLFQGSVDRFDTTLHVPHVGWNVLDTTPHPLLDHLPPAAGPDPRPHVYFVHSYRPTDCNPDDVIATSDYDGPFVCAVARDNIVGTQFHPERSGTDGLRILSAFLDWNP
ncbi:MAG: imidazole glycerol phosphate synthase subunit HisH [Deltaproteobacteria bacterium]|nr:MAG: imidazole glycerol phosphate synthase subunit HisH [Deltaproteobacteria bacterium]